MRTIARFLLAVMIFSTGHGVLHAAALSFTFTVDQKKIGGIKKESSDMTIKTQMWAYTVTMENKSFQDVGDLEIKYVVFSKQEQPGKNTVIGQENLQRREGSTTVKTLRNNDKFSFDTDGVALKTVELSDGYYWASGASSRAKGALRGIWLRVFSGGQLVAEFMDPPGLSSKVTFDPAPKKP